MKMNDERRKVIKELLDVTDREFTDEELIRQLTLTGITQRAAQDEKSTLGQRAADAVARFAGSWAFIFAFTGVLILWMVVNTILAAKAFAP